MPDRENMRFAKVIKGLECCMSESRCYKCPYQIEAECENGTSYYSKAIEDAIALIREQEPIIRCKDCMHSCDYTDIFPDRAYKCIKNGGYHNGSWFCADGERR